MLALAAAAPGATANTPPTLTKTNVVRIPQLGHAANGTLTTRVSYSDATATASAATGNTIGLGKGFYFRLRTCIAYRLHADLPKSSCAERNVDTRSNSATVYTYAPAVVLAAQPRPTTQPWGYFVAYTEVLARNGTIWSVSAHSWPDNGLQGAGIPVAAQGQTVGVLPANSAVRLDGAFTSAVGSGQPDSICTGANMPSDGSPLPAGVTADHAAYAGAPAYYEVGQPTGVHAGRVAMGVMLVVHGGSWMAHGVGAVQSMRPDADRWRARGWITVNFSYRPCGQSAADVLWFYDKTRAAVGTARVCAIGTSAGAHLALLIGAHRPGLHCAVSQAGPTDLRTIHNEFAYDAASGLHNQTQGGRWVRNLGAAAFGEESLARFSPAALAGGSLSRTRVLQAFSADDAMVPFGQAGDLADAMRAANPAAYVDNVQLARGSIPFAHGRVTQAALDDFHAREVQVVGGAPSGTAADALARFTRG